MKRSLLIRWLCGLLLCMLCSLSAHAQETFYIYRNDGGFNAFNKSKVDSITYSKESLEGVLSENFVVQEIYTSDSLYRIPLSVIDSISFIPLETKLNDRVVFIKEWMPYLKVADSTQLALEFSKDLPYKVNTGDVLIYEEFNEQFPVGFAGKVREIIKEENLRIECDSATLDDVFEQLLLYENLDFTKDSISHESDSSRVRPTSELNENFNGTFSHTISVPLLRGQEDNRMDAKLEAGLNGQILLRKQWGMPFFVDITLGISGGMSMTLHLEHKFVEFQFPADLDDLGPLLSRALIDFPIPQTLNLVHLKLHAMPIFRAEAAVNLDATAGGNINLGARVFTDEKGNYNFKFPCSASFGFNASVSLSGSVFGGIRLLPSVTCSGNVLNFGPKIDVGPKMEARVALDSIKVSDFIGSFDYYKKLKDSQVNFSAGGWVSAEAEFNLFDVKIGKSTKEKSWFVNLWNPYLLPEFTEPVYNPGKEPTIAEMSSTPSRNLVMPVDLGFCMLDSAKKVVDTKYCKEQYWTEKEWKKDAMKQSFENLQPGQKYTVHPCLKILGCELLASPTKDIEIGFPAVIEEVKMEKAAYYPDHFKFNKKKYSFKYKCTTKARLVAEDKNIEDWGYIYWDPDGTKFKVSLAEFGKEYTDERLNYFRNTPEATLRLCTYVKYKDKKDLQLSDFHDYEIAYPEKANVDMTNCEFLGTENNVKFEDTTYKYKSSFKFYFTAEGAYWLKVGTAEEGDGWDGWDLPNYQTSPVDGANALTINYYYDDKVFDGDYNVYLKGNDSQHSKSYKTSNYATYKHSDDQFTGCQFNAYHVNHDSRAAGEQIFNIVINKKQ